MASAEIAGSTECELRIDDSIACPGKGNGRDILELVRMAPRDALVVDTLSGLVSQAERVSGQRPIEICSCYSRCHRVIRSRSSVVLFGPTSPSALPEILWHKSIKDALCCLLDPSHTWIAFGSIKDVILASFENGNDLAIFQAHNGPVTMIYPLGASTRILSFGEDQTFAVWDVSTFELTYHSMPISRRAAVTCIATEVVDNSSECGPIIHHIAFGFENAFIQLWENRSEYGHADRWELAFDTSSTSRAAFAAQQDNNSPMPTSSSIVSPSIRSMVFANEPRNVEGCPHSMFDCFSFRRMVAPGSLLIAATCSAVYVMETKSGVIIHTIHVSELVDNEHLCGNPVVSDLTLESDARQLLVGLKDVFGCPWAIIKFSVECKRRIIHCCEDPSEGTLSVIQKISLFPKITHQVPDIPELFVPSWKVGLRRKTTIADSIESRLSSLRLRPSQRKVRSSGYGKRGSDKMFTPRINKKVSEGTGMPFFDLQQANYPTSSSQSTPVSNGSMRATWNKPLLPESVKNIESCLNGGHQQKILDWSKPLPCVNFVQIPAKSVRRIESSGRSEVAVITGDKRVLVYRDMADPKKNDSLAVLSGHASDITDIGFSRSGQFVVTGGMDGELLLHRWNESQMVSSHEESDQSESKRRRVTCAKFFYMDQFIISSFGCKLRLLGYQSKRMTLGPGPNKMDIHGEITMDFHEVTAIGAKNDIYSHIVLCAGSDKSLHVVDLNANQTVFAIREAHKRPIAGLKMFPDAMHSTLPASVHDLFFSSATTDGVKMWDLRRASRCVAQFCSHPSRTFSSSFAVSPCGTYIVANSDSCVALLYDLRFPGAPVHKIEPKETSSEPIIDVSFQLSNRSPHLSVAGIHGEVYSFKF